MKASIAVVDDNNINRVLLKRSLEQSHHVQTFDSAASFLDAVEHGGFFHLVLLDVVMPEMSGHDVLRRLKEQNHLKDTMVIFITMLDHPADERIGLDLGAVDYIKKPFEPRVLLKRVDLHLALQEHQTKLEANNEWLEAEVKRRTAELRMTQQMTTEMLAEAIEFRDGQDSTSSHIRQISHYMATMVETVRHHPELGQVYSQEEWDMIVDAAPLHDIGKIGVERAVLLKPGQLTAEEYLRVKEHVQVGIDIIEHTLEMFNMNRQDAMDVRQPKRFFELARELVATHHEWWDGSGYPNRLVGDSIPLSGRMLAIVDVLDALLSERPYKQSWTFEEAASYIVEGKGTHFDPVLVDVFVSIQDRFHVLYKGNQDRKEEVT